MPENAPVRDLEDEDLVDLLIATYRVDISRKV